MGNYFNSRGGEKERKDSLFTDILLTSAVSQEQYTRAKKMCLVGLKDTIQIRDQDLCSASHRWLSA